MKNEFFASSSFLTGVNYWASHAATQMWSDWDEDVVKNDLSALRQHGTRMLRVFPVWPDFQPIKRLYDGQGKPVEFRMGEGEFPDTEAGRAGMSEVMMGRFERFADIAAEHGMKVIVALLTGHMTARLFMPEGLAGMNPITHPDALLWETRFVRYFVSRMKHHPAIAAWEFGNEIDCMGEASSAAEASVWLALISSAIRVSDPSRPVISGMDGRTVLHNNPWSVHVQAEHCDILTTHHYTMWKSSMTDPLDTIKPTLYAVAENKMYAEVSGRPCFMEEIGTWRPMLGDFETHAAYLRSLCWNLWTNSGRGLLWWCAFDQDHLRIAPYDWDFAGLEHGLLDQQYKVHPTGDELRAFRSFIDDLPFGELPACRPDAVCLLGDNRQPSLDVGVAAFILAKQAGFELEYQHARQPLKDASLYLLPSACGKAGLGGKNWQELRERVKAGATLYLSADDTYLDHFSEVFGAGVHTRIANPGKQELNLRGAAARLTITPKAKAEMRSCGAEILGEDADGSPVFFRHAYGKGTVYLFSYPLERLLMETPQAFLKPETSDAWRVYRQIASAVGIRKTVMKNDPFLSVSEHAVSPTKRIAVVFNHATTDLPAALRIDAGWNVARVISPCVSMQTDGESATGTFPPNSGAVLMLEKK